MKEFDDSYYCEFQQCLYVPIAFICTEEWLVYVKSINCFLLSD